MISRRRFTTGVVIALTPLGATASAQEYKAQPAGRMPVVGYLSALSHSNPEVRRSLVVDSATSESNVFGRGPHRRD